MKRAVLDSSVLVSAFISPRGAVAHMLAELLDRPLEICLSAAILEETARTLLTKAKLRRYARYTDREVEDWLTWLVRIAVMVEPDRSVIGVCRDPADDVIVGTAVGADAAVLITGDDDLLTLNPFRRSGRDVAILASREVLERLDELLS